jgi:hypothetical protein
MLFLGAACGRASEGDQQALYKKDSTADNRISSLHSSARQPLTMAYQGAWSTFLTAQRIMLYGFLLVAFGLFPVQGANDKAKGPQCQSWKVLFDKFISSSGDCDKDCKVHLPHAQELIKANLLASPCVVWDIKDPFGRSTVKEERPFEWTPTGGMCIELAAQDMSGDHSTSPQNVRNPYQEIGSSTSKGKEKDEEDLSQMFSGLSIAASAGFHPKVPKKPNALKKAIFATVLVPASVAVNSVTGGMKAMTSGDTSKSKSKKKSRMKSCHCQLELVIPKFYTGCVIEDLVRQL